MKGIILAGGHGTRLNPLTKIISKQLLPVFDKPLIYYPLSTLMLTGIREIVIICRPDQIELFRHLLGDGAEFGISIIYIEQIDPNGIAAGILLAEHFLGSDNFCLILGDNIFHGVGLGRDLENYVDKDGCHILCYRVSNPQEYGVLELSEDGQIQEINEKPIHPNSNLAITGIYFLDNSAISIAKQILPSHRGELEITDVLKEYLRIGKLKFTELPRGTAWLDTGSFRSLHDAASYVRIMEERNGLKIGDPFEAGKIKGWI